MDQLTLENYNHLKSKGQKILKVVSRTVHTSGLENILEGPGIMVPNHYNWKDILVLGTQIPRHLCFVCQEELLDEKKFTKSVIDVSSETVPFWGRVVYPITSSISRYVVSQLSKIEDALIPVALRGGNNGEFIQNSYEKLIQGDLVCIFPETRKKKNKHEALMPFKSGFARLAYHAESNGLSIPIYPTAIKNSMGLIKDIELVIGKPHYLIIGEENSREDISAFIQIIEGEVNSMLYN